MVEVEVSAEAKRGLVCDGNEDDEKGGIAVLCCDCSPSLTTSDHSLNKYNPLPAASK